MSMELRSKSVGENAGSVEREPGPSRQENTHEDIRVYNEMERRQNIRTLYTGPQLYNKLPTFRGNKKIKEVNQNWTKEENLNTFLRAIDEHLDLYNIQDDKRRIEILSSQIEKDSGDGIYLMDLLDENITYEKFKEQLRKNYGVSDRQVFRNTSINILNKMKNGLRLEGPHTNEEVYKLCKEVQQITESFITGENMRGTNLEPNHMIVHKGGDQIRLKELINSVIIHIFISSVLDESTYKKIKEVRPQNTLVEMCTNIVEVVKEDKCVPGINIPHGKNTEETVFKIGTRKPCDICNRTNHPTEKCRFKITCENCSKKGHLSKDCRQTKEEKEKKYCNNCKRNGHNEETCWKNHMCRICEKKGHMEERCFQNDKKQYCNRCKTNSHSKEKCWKKNNNKRVLNIDEIDIEEHSSTNE